MKPFPIGVDWGYCRLEPLAVSLAPGPAGVLTSSGCLIVSRSASASTIEPELLNRNDCLFLTRPSVFPHNADPEQFRANAANLAEAIVKGHAAVEVDARFPLADLAVAHRTADERRVRGAILIEP